MPADVTSRDNLQCKCTMTINANLAYHPRHYDHYNPDDYDMMTLDLILLALGWRGKAC